MFLLLGFLTETSSSQDVVNSPSAEGLSQQFSLKVLNFPDIYSYALLGARDALDPVPGRSFLVSVGFRMARELDEGDRQIILSKYDGKQSPFPGWAIAVRRYSTSVRPEVYWRDKRGNGGWFTFDRLSFPPQVSSLESAWCSVLLVWKPSGELFLYFSQVSVDDVVGAIGDSTDSLVRPVDYRGGYYVPTIELPNTSAEVQVGAPRGLRRRALLGDVAWLSIADGAGDLKLGLATGLPSASGEPEADKSAQVVIPDLGIRLFLGGAPADRGTLGVPVELRGKAQWINFP